MEVEIQYRVCSHARNVTVDYGVFSVSVHGFLVKLSKGLCRVLRL